MSQRRTVGATIAGLGTAGYHLAGAAIRLSPTHTSIDGPIYYIPQLAAWPRAIRTELAPLDGRVSQATIDLAVTGVDQSDSATLGVRIGKTLLEFLWGVGRRKVGRLLADVAAGDPSINIQVLPGAATPAAGDILYLGRQVLYVSWTPSGTTSSLTVPVDHGLFLTPDEDHDDRDPYVYSANPIGIDRELTLYELDLLTETETARFHGVIENFKLDKNLMRLLITARDLLGRITDRNLGADRLQGKIRVDPYPLDISGTSEGRIYWGFDDGDIVPYKPIYADNDGTIGPGTGKVVALEIDKHAVLLQATEVTTPSRGSWGYRHRIVGGIHARAIDGQLLDVGDKGKEYGFREILIGDADNPHSLFKDANGAASDHPADLLRCILASTGSATWPGGGSHTVGTNGDFDWLPKPFGLAIPDALINHDAFDALINNYPTRGLRARNFYLGQGDEDIAAGDVIFDLAIAMNGYIYLDEQGRIGARWLGDPGPDGVDATLTADDIAWMRGASGGAEAGMNDQAPVYAIKLELCQKGPGGDPQDFIKGTDLNFYEVSRRRYQAKEDVIEATRIYGDPETHQIGGLFLRVAQVFASRFAYTQQKLPTYDITLHNAAPRVTAGQWVTLSHPAMVEVDHTRGITEHRCLVLSADWAPETGRQQLRVVDWAPISQWDTTIAPSWRIAAVASDTVFDIEDAEFSAVDDLTHWRDAASGSYVVTLWTANGLRRDTNGAEGTLTANEVTLAAAWDDGAPVTPAVGDIVRIVPYDSASDWYATRKYTAIANNNPTLGAGGDDAHLWSV